MTEALGIRESITRSEVMPIQVVVTTALGTTPAVDLQGCDGFAARSPNGDVATLTVYGAEAEGGTYTAIQYKGTDIVLSLSGVKAAIAEDLHTGCFPFRWLKLVGDAAGLVNLVGAG